MYTTHSKKKLRNLRKRRKPCNCYYCNGLMAIDYEKYLKVKYGHLDDEIKNINK